MDYLTAIARVHTDAASISEKDGVYTALGKDGNSITINQTLVNAEAERMVPVAAAMAEINRLENLVTQRRVRDSVTTDDGKQWMVDQEALIATERGKL